MSITALQEELLDELRHLQAEHALARLEGLPVDHPEVVDLQDEIAAANAAYIGYAVTAIATLRGQLGRRTQG
jgi:hypothetical protein